MKQKSNDDNDNKKTVETCNSESVQKPTEKLTWEMFWNQLSESVDDDIIQYHQESGRVFLGGKCRISSIQKGFFYKRRYLNIEAELYFTANSEKEAEQRTVIRKCPYENFKDDSETQKQLKNVENEPVIFDIASPL